METIYLLLLAATIFVSCKKYQPAQEELSKQIIGTWELVNVITDAGNFMYLPGNGITIAFLPGSVIERKANHTLQFKGTYSTEKKTDCFPSDKNTILKTSDDPNLYYYIEVKDGKLSLSTPNCYADGGVMFYRKL